jgi:Protein of unknown function (DUF2752)
LRRKNFKPQTSNFKLQTSTTLLQLLNIADWLERNALACSFKKNLGITCPGCGLQSSFIALLRGDLWLSLKLYPATLPILFTFVFTALHLIFKFKHGAAIIKWSFGTSAALMLLNFIFKIIRHLV